MGTRRKEVSGLYERLRKEYPLWCQGKTERVLRASCEYMERIQEGVTQNEIAAKYRITPESIRRWYVQIYRLLELEKETGIVI